jgi:hypothetical protein
MKYLLLFFITLNTYGSEWTDRVNAKDKNFLWTAAVRAGFWERSRYNFRKNLLENPDPVKMAKIEAEYPAVQALYDAKESQKVEYAAAEERMKNSNCSTLPNQILKDMCTLRKGR